jgi:hypothetical protein|tara:strand:+ start:3901 stop:4164 length:264 start_codon:yes stop_codon:yes gene_type:complete
MKLQEHNELIAYLSEVVSCVKELAKLASTRNKTKKFKAMASLLKIVEARATASLMYAKSGGYSELPLAMQQHMYTPIMDYLGSEVSS